VWFNFVFKVYRKRTVFQKVTISSKSLDDYAATASQGENTF
jgi:hypothetical protein